MCFLLEELEAILDELHPIFELLIRIFEKLWHILEHRKLLLEEQHFIRSFLVLFELLTRILENPSLKNTGSNVSITSGTVYLIYSAKPISVRTTSAMRTT